MADIFMHSVNWVRSHRQRFMLLLSAESDAASNLVITGSVSFGLEMRCSTPGRRSDVMPCRRCKCLQGVVAPGFDCVYQCMYVRT